MSYFLSKEESNFYEDEGYLVRENQFSINEVNALRHALERAVNKAQEKSSGGKAYYLDKKKFVWKKNRILTKISIFHQHFVFWGKM